MAESLLELCMRALLVEFAIEALLHQPTDCVPAGATDFVVTLATGLADVFGGPLPEAIEIAFGTM